MRRHWSMVGVALAALGVCGPAAATVPAGGGAVQVQAAFTASMPDRFGGDADGDGRIDLPNSTAYVQAGTEPSCGAACGPLFTLRLDGGASVARWGGEALPLSYRWEISGPRGREMVRRGTGPTLDIRLPEGRYQIALEAEAVLPWGTVRGRAAHTVVVEDLLIVAIGDSYASGEGNPERGQQEGGAAALWANAPGDVAAEASHAAAHRSTGAWPALAALALERADPATSVTFVSVAASKAQVTAGLLEPQPAISPLAQIDEVAALVGERRIDLLLVSVGGNDVGFARIVRGLVDADRLADPVCYGTDLQNVWDAAGDGNWNRGSSVVLGLPWGVECRAVAASGRPVLPGLQGLPAELDRLAEAIAQRLAPGAVYLMEYPDPTGDGGQSCDEIVGDVTPPFRFHEIDRAEMEGGRERVVQPLNRILAEAAARHGWHFVGGVAESFAGHQYCGSRPDYGEGGAPGGGGLAQATPGGTGSWYRHAATLDPPTALGEAGVSWFRTAAQSVVLQGPADAWQTTGTLHPNELGHLALAAALVAAISAD